MFTNILHRFAIVFLIILPSLLFCTITFSAQEKAEELNTASDTDIATYRKFLDKLDARDYRSISIARDEMQRLFSKASEETAETAFRWFYNFYSYRAIPAINRAYFCHGEGEYQGVLNAIMFGGNPERIGGMIPHAVLHDDPIQTLKTQEDTFQKQMKERYGATLKDLCDMRENGIRFSWSEGTWYAVEDEEYIFQAGSFLKGEYLDYLRFKMEAAKENLTEDGGLLVPWDTLRKRIILYETFDKKHPDFEETKDEILRELHKIFWWYLGMLPNSPAYDWYETKAIYPEVRESYERFLAENRSSIFFPVVSKVYDIWKSHDYIHSEELDSYISDMGFNHYLSDGGYSIFLDKYHRGYKD